MSQNIDKEHLLICTRKNQVSSLDGFWIKSLPYLKKMASTMLEEKFRDLGKDADEVVNQCYILIRKKENLQIKEQSHFFRLTGKIMHCYLTDCVRKKNSNKHWGQLTRLDLEENTRIEQIDLDHQLMAKMAFTYLKKEDPLLFQVAALRTIHGHTLSETAKKLRIPIIRVNRLWRKCKTLLISVHNKSLSD